MAVTPNQTPRIAGTPGSGAYVGAAILIVIGSLTLLGNLYGNQYTGEAIPLGIGLAFFVAYALTRKYGFLVPGGILTGVGGGLLVATLLGASDDGAYVVLGGGLGFLTIYAFDAIVNRAANRWWPLIPGGIMLLVGGGLATQNEGVIKQIGTWSPLLLIVLGLWIVIASTRRSPR